ncbi:unnamed protein product [Pocillopora meandrina]|uniref:Uncharacterized protein n=1 Tax=Pocillopora meandrina TaxID=46732 RepID=A0AAU9WCY7_9CNID|nr:unnamed protein product [Pocillopora meandrina]
MWSDLRAAVPQGSDVLHYLASSLPDVALASRTPSASSKYFSSYKRCGELSPTEHPLVKSVLAGAQRLLAHHTSKKEPITVFRLEQLVACKADSMASLYSIRSFVICLLTFAAFLRLDELAKLVRFDVEIENDIKVI